MGRETNYSEKKKKVSGHEARNQKTPMIPQHLQDERLVLEEECPSKKSKLAQNFTDDNVEWLKPKKNLFDDDLNEEQPNEEDIVLQDNFFDSSDYKDGEKDKDLLPLDKASKKLSTKQAESKKREKDELHPLKKLNFHPLAKKLRPLEKLNFKETEIYSLPSSREIEMERIANLQVTPDLKILFQRVRDHIYVLSDFESKREEIRSRIECIRQLQTDLCSHYGYNEFLMETLMLFFPSSELIKVLEANKFRRPMTIRTNTLKTRRGDLAQALINRGVNVDHVGKWSKVGLVVYDAQIPIDATPEYLAGHYILQSAASLLPVMALAPRENEKILDMCAAHGGKTTHIAALMKNTGVLVANAAVKDRANAIVGNLDRLGVTNTIVSTQDGRNFAEIMAGFDRVLCDAPCSGSGVVSKYPSVKASTDAGEILRYTILQRLLLMSAIDCTNTNSKSGGYIVYSTCSILPDENEYVIDYVLKKRSVKLVSTGLDFGEQGLNRYQEDRFHPSLKLCKRFYPHIHKIDGFFVAKLKKFSNVIPGQTPPPTAEEMSELGRVL